MLKQPALASHVLFNRAENAGFWGLKGAIEADTTAHIRAWHQSQSQLTLNVHQSSENTNSRVNI